MSKNQTQTKETKPASESGAQVEAGAEANQLSAVADQPSPSDEAALERISELEEERAKLVQQLAEVQAERDELKVAFDISKARRETAEKELSELKEQTKSPPKHLPKKTSKASKDEQPQAVKAIQDIKVAYHGMVLNHKKGDIISDAAVVKYLLENQCAVVPVEEEIDFHICPNCLTRF